MEGKYKPVVISYNERISIILNILFFFFSNVYLGSTFTHSVKKVWKYFILLDVCLTRDYIFN